MKRGFIFLYGIISYLLFFSFFLYLVGFLGGFYVPKTVASPEKMPWQGAFFINVLLLVLFSVQHSGMARSSFKKWLTRFIPQPMERSTYVLSTVIIFSIVLWLWQPMNATIWQVENSIVVFVINALFWLGWGILLISTYLIDHFELFGLKQVYFQLRKKQMPAIGFVTPFFYKYVRHPMMIGIIVAMWATPHLTVGHLIFALGMTIYIGIGVAFEEKDLIKHFGKRYRAYQAQVPSIIPNFKRKVKRPTTQN